MPVDAPVFFPDPDDCDEPSPCEPEGAVPLVPVGVGGRLRVLTPALDAIALLAAACNGHSSTAFDQEWIDNNGFTFQDHNHLAHEDPNWAHDIAFVEWGTNYSGWGGEENNTYGVKVCTIGITASETDPLNDNYGQTLKCKDHVEGWEQGNSSRYIEVDNLYFLSDPRPERRQPDLLPRP